MIEEIKEEDKNCEICYELSTDLIELNCGHKFCSDCFE